jgi:hypothetical protein
MAQTPAFALRPQVATAYVPPVVVIPPPMPTPPAADATLADITRLRAMTDYAAGMQARADASRALAPSPVVTVPVPGASVPISQAPFNYTVPVPPPPVNPAENIDDAARNNDAARTL